MLDSQENLTVNSVDHSSLSQHPIHDFIELAAMFDLDESRTQVSQAWLAHPEVFIKPLLYEHTLQEVWDELQRLGHQTLMAFFESKNPETYLIHDRSKTIILWGEAVTLKELVAYFGNKDHFEHCFPTKEKIDLYNSLLFSAIAGNQALFAHLAGRALLENAEDNLEIEPVFKITEDFTQLICAALFAKSYSIMDSIIAFLVSSTSSNHWRLINPDQLKDCYEHSDSPQQINHCCNLKRLDRLSTWLINKNHHPFSLDTATLLYEKIKISEKFNLLSEIRNNIFSLYQNPAEKTCLPISFAQDMEDEWVNDPLNFEEMDLIEEDANLSIYCPLVYIYDENFIWSKLPNSWREFLLSSSSYSILPLEISLLGQQVRIEEILGYFASIEQFERIPRKELLFKHYYSYMIFAAAAGNEDLFRFLAGEALLRENTFRIYNNDINQLICAAMYGGSSLLIESLITFMTASSQRLWLGVDEKMVNLLKKEKNYALEVNHNCNKIRKEWAQQILTDNLPNYPLCLPESNRRVKESKMYMLMSEALNDLKNQQVLSNHPNKPPLLYCSFFKKGGRLQSIYNRHDRLNLGI